MRIEQTGVFVHKETKGELFALKEHLSIQISPSNYATNTEGIETKRYGVGVRSEIERVVPPAMIA